MENLEIREYFGTKIEFKIIDGEVYANATTMTESKKLENWKASPNTKKYLEALKNSNSLKFRELIFSKVGGKEAGGGTWIHEKLILSLARYISVEFELWCDEQIATLLREGAVTLQPKLPTNYLEALEALVVSEKEKIKLIAITEEQKPKVEVYEQISDSTTLHSFKEVADLLNIKGLGRNNLISLLKSKGILTKTGEAMRTYIERKYFEEKLGTFKINGSSCSATTTKVTGKGLIWLTKMLKQN